MIKIIILLFQIFNRLKERAQSHTRAESARTGDSLDMRDPRETRNPHLASPKNYLSSRLVCSFHSFGSLAQSLSLSLSVSLFPLLFVSVSVSISVCMPLCLSL